MDSPQLDRWCPGLGVVGVSVEYRLSPETGYPGPLEDCYAALRWTYDNAGDLGIDRERIGLYGLSAGGGLAAALALLARDRGDIPLAFVLLDCPMLDDRQQTPSIRSDGLYVWGSDSNEFGWRAYLGALYGSDEVPPYAAAARAADLRGLPPTCLVVGSIDGFRDVGAVESTEVRTPAEFVGADAPHVEPVRPHGGRLLAVVEHGAVEQHEGERDFAAIAGQQGQRGSEPSPGTEPVDPDAILVDAELGRVVVGPAQRCVAVLERPRVGRLGGQAVLDGDADDAEAGAPPVEQRAVHVVGADDVAASVDGDDGGQQPRRGASARCTRTGTGGSPGTSCSVRTTASERSGDAKDADRMAATPSASTVGSSNASSTGRSSGSSRFLTFTRLMPGSLPPRMAATRPPSTGRSIPLMKLASSERRNAAPTATSSARPSRPMGDRLTSISLVSRASASWRPMGVSIIPGVTEQMRAPTRPKGTASRRTSRCTPRLLHV